MMSRYRKQITVGVVYFFTVFVATSPLVPQDKFQLVRPKSSVSTTITLQPQDAEPISARDAEPDFSMIQVPQEVTTPSITIKGGEFPIEIGELIQLWVEIDSVDDSLHSVNYSWTVLPNRDVTIWPDGSRILFGTGTQHDSYVVVLTASFVFAETGQNDEIVNIHQRAVTQQQIVQISGATGDGASISLIQETIEPEEEARTINLGPGPELDTLGGMAKNAYDWVRGVEISPQYTEVDVKMDASRLFASFTSVASDIESGTLDDLNAILSATMKRNAGVLSNKSAWRPWFNDMSAAVEDVYNEGGLREMDEIAQIWHGIAQGLNEASK